MSAAKSQLDRRIFRIAYWVAVIGFVVGSIVSAFSWVADFSSANQYDQSPICLFSLDGPCPASDVTEKTATVIDTGKTGARPTEFWVDLSGLTPEPKQVVLPHGDGVWPLLHAGDEVTVLFWRGLITGLQNDKASSQA